MQVYKILLVDDEEPIRDILKLYFEKDGFETVEAINGAQALTMVEKNNPDMIILDIMMPVMDGLEVCRQLRKFSDIPIIMLTAKSEDDDRILGLEMGADDYIGKPFNPKEVLARAKAVLRRTTFQEKITQPDGILDFDELHINMHEYKVVAFGKQVALTVKEMELLWYLAKNVGKVFQRNQLLENVWGYTYYGDTRTVDTHIKRLRSKLNTGENGKWDIKTVWGVGYKFELMQSVL